MQVKIHTLIMLSIKKFKAPQEIEEIDENGNFRNRYVDTTQQDCHQV